MRVLNKNNFLFIALLCLIALLRFYHCFQVPLYTTDALRNLGYGIEFSYYGFQVYEYTPADFSPALYQYFWPMHHYTYPPVTLLFFAALAAIWPSLVMVKLALTFIDILNAWLFARITKEPWLGFYYFTFPTCIWFGSREGQFETFVNLWSLLAILFLLKGQGASLFFLSFAVRSKIFPIFLLPYFLSKLPYREPKRCLSFILWGLLSFVPSLVAMLYSDYPANLFQDGYVPKNNPVTWAIFDRGLHAFTPFWLVLSHFIAGILFVGTCLYFMRSEQRIVPYLAPLLFVVFIKSNMLGQFWYFMQLPVFCLTVENVKHRRILLAIALLFSIRSLYSLFIGPVGYQNPDSVMRILQKAMYGI